MQVLSKVRKPQLSKKSIKDLHPCKVFDAKIKKYIEYYGDDINETCRKYKSALRFLLPAIASVAVLSYFIHYFLFSVPALALITYLYPLLYVWAKAEDHKKVVNNEAPFVALIAYIDSIVDKGLNYTLKELSEIKELKVPKVENVFFTKMTNYMSMSFVKALERRSRVHTGDLLGKLYSNYLASYELGFTLTDRLRDTLQDLLNDLKDVFKNYAYNKSGEFTELEFAILLLTPIVMIGFSFTFKVSLIQLYLPLLATPGLIYLVSASQPSFDYILKYKYVWLLALIPVALAIPFISLTYRLLIATAVIVAVSYFIYDQIRLAKELENSLPTLIKELAEYLKIGYTIPTAIPKIKLGKNLNKIIERYANNPENVNTPSKLFNLTFKLLFVIAKTGYSSVALQELGNALYEIVYNKNSITKQLQLFDILTVMTPFMLWLTFAMLGQISSALITPMAVIVPYSIASAIIFSKVSRFTLLYFPTMLMLFVVLVILAFMPASVVSLLS